MIIDEGENQNDIDFGKRSVYKSVNIETIEKAIRTIGINDNEDYLIVIDDCTRSTPVDLVLPRLIKHMLINKVNYKKISIIMATGTHRRVSDKEILKKVGAYVFRKYKVHQHSIKDCMVLFGKTMHNVDVYLNSIILNKKVIIIGSVSFSLFADFSGGCKAILPGISSLVTIKSNHKLACFDLCNKTSIMRKDIDSVIQLLDPPIMINFILNTNNDIIDYYVGDVISGHKYLIDQYKKKYSIRFSNKTRSLIINLTRYKSLYSALIKMNLNNIVLERIPSFLLIFDLTETSMFDKVVNDYKSIMNIYLATINNQLDPAIGGVAYKIYRFFRKRAYYYNISNTNDASLKILGLNKVNSISSYVMKNKNIAYLDNPKLFIIE